MDHKPFQFELWRLLVSVALFATACGLLRWTLQSVAGDAGWTITLGSAALVCFASAIGVFFSGGLEGKWRAVLGLDETFYEIGCLLKTVFVLALIIAVIVYLIMH